MRKDVYYDPILLGGGWFFFDNERTWGPYGTKQVALTVADAISSPEGGQKGG